MDPDENAACRLADADAQRDGHATMHGPPPRRFLAPSDLPKVLENPGAFCSLVGPEALNDVLDVVTEVNLLGHGRIWVIGRADPVVPHGL
jgi:hypothetical protein